MLLTETGLELIEQVERQQDVPSLLASFKGVVQYFGMHAFCIGDPTGYAAKCKSGRWLGHWPQEWTQHYSRREHFGHDPLVAQMTRSATPFRWSSTYARASARARLVLDDAADFGLTEGLAIPIHGFDGRPVAGVSIGSFKYQLSGQDERVLHMAALYLHARLTVLRPAAPPPPIGKLTPRERECLTWVAAGKTDWEISQILDISEQTAHGYVQGALIKLDARTRAQAVALAIQSAQILQ
jgi:LuxR family transcriptional regulator, quorum-sensing system regulator BjaR1